MSKKKISPEVQAILSASDAGLLATTVGLVKRFLVENPDSQRAWLDLGRALGQLAQYEEAKQAFLKVIELSGSPEGAIFGELGNLDRTRGDFESAITWYQKQIEADPDDGTGYLFLGNLLMRQGNLESSETALQQALAADQVCLDEAHFSLGLVYRSQGRLAEAKTHFESALEIDENFAAAKLALKDVKSASA
jgi:tetratricopeptide (TPR) repeat protein